MNELPLVSVCLITYNHKKYIEQAIESVLMQKTSFNWEFIIADDFSTDGTRNILLEYKQKYPELINLILQEHNIGPAGNWMSLMEKPRGKYIAYFEGDDYWTDPLKLQKQVDVLEKDEKLSMAAHGSYKLTDTLSLIDSPFKVDTIWTAKDILTNNWFIMSASLMFRKSMMDFSPAWYPEISHGDLALILLTSLKGNGFYTPQPMSVYRIAGSGVMSRFALKDSTSYIFLLNQFNRMSDYKFNKEITTQQDRIRIDIVHQYIALNKTTNLFSLKYWQNVIQCLKWARIRNWPNLAKKLVKGKLSK
jgi:glycosyltransferase involved in cell wall biosynthesis